MFSSKKAKLFSMSMIVVLSIFVSFVFVSTPVDAMREECYTTGYVQLDLCSCTHYTCYVSGTVSWDGGYAPAGGMILRQGGTCTNGYSWSDNNYWGPGIGNCIYE